MLLNVQREGMAKKLGHDLVLEVTRWNATVSVDGDVASSSVTATADTRSLEIKEARGGAKALSANDEKDIKKNINDKVLKTGQHPEMTFTSTAVKAEGDTRYIVEGDLTIMGSTRPATMEVSVSGGKATGTMTITQSQWGIKPFSAMMGALKVKDAIEVVIEAPVPS